MNNGHQSSIPAAGDVVGLTVFVNGAGGGNPVPLVADARGLDAEQMRRIAHRYGHESAFVLPAQQPGADWQFRFFVPKHEMEMCGHATVGTLWALRQWGLWTTDEALIETSSGPVAARWDATLGQVWVSQPSARMQALSAPGEARVRAALGLSDAMGDLAMCNASTSRVKTLVRLPDVAAVDALTPDYASIEAVCEEIGSTGLYPYAIVEGATDVVCARQFPKSSGYPEDAATGIAAAALWGYLAAAEQVPVGTAARSPVCTVRQGERMGRPSAIQVMARFDASGRHDGCWLSGGVAWSAL